MIPILPSNPNTITPRGWDTGTIEGCKERLRQLRQFDTLMRETCEAREMEKRRLEDRIKILRHK